MDFNLTVIFKIIWDGRLKLNENKRREYLSAMGIELFYPTDDVQAIKGKQDTFFSENDPKSQARDYPKHGLVAGTTPPAIHEDSSSYKKNSNQVIDKNNSSEKSQSELIKEERIHGNGSTLSFSLNYYFLSDKLAVLEETTKNGSVFHRKEYLNLLRKIVSALGVDVENQSYKPESISWPVAGVSSLPIDQKSAARQMLNGYIRRKSQEAQFANLLIFADTIPDLFTSKKKPGGEKDFFNDEEGFHLTICEALSEMLARPELKRNVWNSLQPLRKRIMSS